MQNKYNLVLTLDIVTTATSFAFLHLDNLFIITVHSFPVPPYALLSIELAMTCNHTHVGICMPLAYLTRYVLLIFLLFNKNDNQGHVEHISFIMQCMHSMCLHLARRSYVLFKSGF